jgi:hypothetical protein
MQIPKVLIQHAEHLHNLQTIHVAHRDFHHFHQTHTLLFMFVVLHKYDLWTQCTPEKNWSWRNTEDPIVSIPPKQYSQKESKNQAYLFRWNIFYIKSPRHIEQVKFNIPIMIGWLFFTTCLD